MPDGISDDQLSQVGLSGDLNENLLDFVTTRFSFGVSYDRISKTDQKSVRDFLYSFYDLMGGSSNLLRTMERDGLSTLPPRLKNALDLLSTEPEFAQELLSTYVKQQHEGIFSDIIIDDQQRELSGYKILNLIDVYKGIADQEKLEDVPDQEDYIKSQLNQIGTGFEPLFDHIDTQSILSEHILNRPGKFREDTTPEMIARWQCRIGASTFPVPPTSINVSQAFHTGSLTGGAIRQGTSPKTNLGHSDTVITMELIFPNHESIWGFKGDKANPDIFNWDPNPIEREDIPDIFGKKQIPGVTVSDSVIDHYLSSLRGLIAQFRYAPILPVRNEYLNRTYGISAVTLNNLSVSTMENFPFALSVTLTLNKFNYTPFLPMIQDFDQAIHWGKFRQYLGRAASALDAKVNEGFLIEVDDPDGDTGDPKVTYQAPAVPTFDKLKDLYDGKDFNLYYPKTTPSRIFAPDTTDFRQPGEDEVVTQDIWDGVLSSIGLDIVQAPRFNFFEYSNASRRSSSEANLLNSWLASNNILWNHMSDEPKQEWIDSEIAKGKRNGSVTSSNEALRRTQLNDQWYFTFFKHLVGSDYEIEKARKALEESGNYIIKEWEVPMERLRIDWSTCIVQGVSVNLSNNFARMQIQLQESPTFQYIGGGDSTVNVRFIVLGEENLINLKRVFEHINGLARLEQAHGVLGFLGIKNVITSLCGIKYVLPNSFEVDTIPEFPHVYDVRMSFVDFDIRQQQREELSSDAQQLLVDTFGKRNPFLRTKQVWNFFNGYPDLPLSVSNSQGDILGYLDPDWYFRSFATRDEDLYDWRLDEKMSSLFKELSEVQVRINNNAGSSSGDKTMQLLAKRKVALETSIRDLYETSGASLLPGFVIENGTLKLEPSTSDPNATAEKAEMRQYLGVYGDDNEVASFIDFFRGGYFMLGTENTKTNNITYITGMTRFREDLASVNSEGLKSINGTVGLDQYQTEYIDKSASPQKQFETIMQDFHYRDLKGRMLKAFPTYMLWLIDEGGKFAGVKLYDNFYGLNSIIDFSVVTSQNSIDDTLVLRLSNIYQKLTTPYREGLINEDDPLYETPIGRWINLVENRYRNTLSGLTNEIIELNQIRLKPGVRVHLRVGYGSNPNALQTVFNGTITELQQGDIMTVVCQSDAVEFTSMVNSSDAKGSSGKLDGGINTGFWMSEPRDLIVRLLSMGTSSFKEWVSWGSKGVMFSESKFGIRHFGSILYEPMNKEEKVASNNVYGAVLYASNDANGGSANADRFASLTGEFAKDLSELDKLREIPSAIGGNMVQLAKLLWTNSFTTRDYELFKRNVYPGNGTGLAQYMGGDMIDAGIIVGELTAMAGDEEETTESGSSPKPRAEGWNDIGKVIQDAVDSVVREVAETARVTDNETLIPAIWKTYQTQTGLSDEELISLLDSPNLAAIDLTQYRAEERGLFESLIGRNEIMTEYGLTGDLFGIALDKLTNITGTEIDDFIVGNMMTPGKALIQSVSAFGKPLNTLSRVFSSPVGRSIGFYSASEDDDIDGYDEVSFRAQTYMKTVWDLFKVCAALLPNYIVAVRPFEDRSTLFYGKPHWLYTSGVIPVSSGIPNDPSLSPKIEDPDTTLREVLKEATKETGFEKLTELASDSKALKEIMDFTSEESIDPYNVGGSEKYINDEIDAIVKQTLTWISDEPEAVQTGVTKALNEIAVLMAQFTSDEIQAVLYSAFGEGLVGDIFSGGTNELSDFDDDVDVEYVYQKTIDVLTFKFNYIADQMVNPSGKDMFEVWLAFDSKNADEYRNQLTNFLGGEATVEAAKNDPVTFAWQFGWKFSYVPVWIDPRSGYGIDNVGNLARAKYDESFSVSVKAIGDRGLSEAVDIWRDIRTDDFRAQPELRDIFNRFFPEATDNFDQVLDTFMRFLWQDPYNRAWVSIVVDRKGDGALDTLNPFGDNSRHWNWEKVNRAFEFFITNPISFDANRVPHSGAARRYMEANEAPGKDAGNIVSGLIEDASDWVDQNIGQVLGLVSDTLTGFVASIRLSLSQMSNALSQSGEMQKQANILNSVFNDSIYYKQGSPDSLLRLVDNPFTREYGEPVVEIREPFQRIHMISSFDSIINNGIQENLNEVPTVVVAVSDGKYPQKVHFDKGIPPDRQVEKIVETGLYWDNAVGGGLFGIFHPLIHPFETMRAYSKAFTGSSDQLSARRVGLAHLKEGLKDIYQGEILMVGNADIRPYDLLFIADVYSRMYGMVEVEQVVHHFTPDTGFVTSITPNALVTVNDPARWTMLSYVWSKMLNKNLRDDVRANMAVNIDRNLASATSTIKQEDIYSTFSTQMNGSIQYTQGNSGIVKDISAMFTTGGLDEQWNQIAKVDIALGALKPAATLAGGAIGSIGGPGVGTVIGAAGGYVVGDLLWEGWQWVKENLLDQHGCYISFLNKDGMPMDAGLSYYSGVAVGTNHTVELLPSILGLNDTKAYVKENGHYRITTDDLLGSLGWTEVETTSLFRETSLYVNNINKEILNLANRGVQEVSGNNVGWATAEILLGENPGSEDEEIGHIVDGDTFDVRIIDTNMSGLAKGTVKRIRLAAINTYELKYKNNPYTVYNETLNNAPNDLALLAYQYLLQRFQNGSRLVAIRFDKSQPEDDYNRLVGVVFHNAPLGTAPSKVLDTLKNIATREPLVPWDSFLEDGRPYTLNWEMIMTGYGNVDMRDSLWNTPWRDNAVVNAPGAN